MRKAWWRDNGIFVVGIVLAGLFTTGACAFLDMVSAGSSVPLIYWAFVAAGALPVAYGFWHLRVHRLWFGFGVWVGLICLLPWIPTDEAKRLFLAAGKLHEGMTLAEVRATMRGFSEEEETPPQTIVRDVRVFDNWLATDNWDPTPGYRWETRPATPKRLMKHGFGDVVMTLPDTASFRYGWDLNGSADMDAVTVTLKHDSVVGIAVTTEM